MVGLHKRTIRERILMNKICLTCEFYTPYMDKRSAGYCDRLSKDSTDDETCSFWLKDYVIHQITEANNEDM